MWHLFKFKRRPSLDIMERTTHDLTKQREFHEGERTTFEALAAHYSEAARQHREAAAALSDALMTLGVAADAGVAHVVLSAAIQDDIEAAKAVAAASDDGPSVEIIEKGRDYVIIQDVTTADTGVEAIMPLTRDQSGALDATLRQHYDKRTRREQSGVLGVSQADRIRRENEMRRD